MLPHGLLFFFNSFILLCPFFQNQLRIYVPGSTVFLGLDRTSLAFAAVSLRRSLAPASSLVQEVASGYLVDALLRSPQLVGSLQLLGSPTLLVAALVRGVRDLILLPLEALPRGPSATCAACLLGLASCARHTSGGDESWRRD